MGNRRDSTGQKRLTENVAAMLNFQKDEWERKAVDRVRALADDLGWSRGDALKAEFVTGKGVCFVVGKRDRFFGCLGGRIGK